METSTAAFISLVKARRLGTPCLQLLLDFLSAPQTSMGNERICEMIYAADQKTFAKRYLNRTQLPAELRNPSTDAASHALPRILIVEDITKETIMHLGDALSIDPLFFASHIHGAWRESTTQSPKFCELPSQVKNRNFTTFSYHRSFVFPELDDKDYKLLRHSHIRRKVIVFPGSRGHRLGLVQHCCSVLVTRNNRGWIGEYNVFTLRHPCRFFNRIVN